MRKFTYGPEADDYFRSLLLFDGDRLSTLLLTLDLARGEVTATLPGEVDVTQLYRFRTDIFWGRPSGAPTENRVTCLSEFLVEFGNRENSILVSEYWTMTAFDPERHDVDHFLYKSTKWTGERRYCRFLRLRDVDEHHVRSFLNCCDRDHPIIVADLSSDIDEAEDIYSGNEVSEKTLSAIVGKTTNLIVDVYDGGAYLIWNRRSPEYNREKRQKGNVGIT